MSKQLAYPHTVRDIVLEYIEKKEAMQGNIAEFQKSIDKLNYSCEVGMGAYEPVVSSVFIHKADAERILRASTWRAVYKVLNLDSVFSAKDRKAFDQQLSNPPEPTPENLAGTFGKYWDNPRYYILKGLAEVFCSLDKFYKSHSNFGFGIKGLPKRAIIGNFGTHGSWGSDRLVDMCKALEQAKPDAWFGEFVSEEDRKPWRTILSDNTCVWVKARTFKVEQFGIEVRTFLNGNAHIYFNSRALNLINDCLHEFYGTVLPDDFERPTQKQASTEVSKDLAFYPTPISVVEHILERVHIDSDSDILEPSCGEGAILQTVKRKFENCRITGVEYHPGRAEISRSKGFNVWTGNFLEYQNVNAFDYVIMNPPFASQHWVKHVKKANECLKDGACGIAILPANAEKHPDLPKGGRWYDLPMGSFKESGTNVNTGYYVWRKQFER